MRKSICILMLATIYLTSYGQVQNAIVNGSVVDQNSRLPIEFASVDLLTTDSLVTQSTVTDKKGHFIFEKVSTGRFILRFSFIGYSMQYLPLVVDHAKENVGIIAISTEAKNLGEVTVTAKKSLLNTGIDRKIYNVSQDIQAQSGSASDILRNIPSVEVDIEGNVTLRGSGDMMILINGRPSPLMGKTRGDALQQLPANSIERIEVITNPSAKYRPDGTSGIINIVLKNNSKLGWNGNITMNVGSNNRFNSGANFSYNPGKINLSGDYNYRHDRRYRSNFTDREYFDNSGNTESYYSEWSRSVGQPDSHSLGLGIEYTLDEKDIIGLSVGYYHRKLIRSETSVRTFLDAQRQKTLHFNRLRYDPEAEKEEELTASWDHRFKEEDHELRAEITISGSSDMEDNKYSNLYYFPLAASEFDNVRQKDKDDWQYATIEYSKPFNEDAKLETGYEGSFNHVELDIYAEAFDASRNRFLKDWEKSSLFRYKGFFHALYAVYEKGYDKFGYALGLRAEQALTDVYLVSKDTQATNQYFKIYPTVHLSWQLKSGELQLNYSKRVNRPDGDELSPFSEYRDPYTLSAGNPELLPEIIHSVEFGYKYQKDKFSFVPGIYYRYKTNGFTSITKPLNDTVLLTRDENLGKDHSAGLEMIFSLKAGKFLVANLSSNLFYNQINASRQGFENRSIISMSTQFNATMQISPTTMGQLSGNFRSARLTLQGRSLPSFVLNAGVKQQLLKKKLSITFTIADFLKTQRQENVLNSPFVFQRNIGRRDARIIFLGLSYRFGSTLKKPAEEKLQFDDNL